MKKISTIITILLLLIPFILADDLYINSGGSDELIIGYANNDEIGFFQTITEKEFKETTESGGLGGGNINTTLIEVIECEEGYLMYNDVCYPCETQLQRIGTKLYCIDCGDGHWNGESCVYTIDSKGLAYVLGLLLLGTFISVLVYKERKKKKSKETKQLPTSKAHLMLKEQQQKQ